MSKKVKKKQNLEEDSLWEEKEQQSLEKIEEIKNHIQDNDQEDHIEQTKSFEFDFKNQKQFLKKQKEIERKQQQRNRLLQQIKRQEQQLQKQEKPILSDSDLAQKADRKQKQRRKKEKKQKLKQQRKEAEKILEAIQSQKKQQEDKIIKIVEAEYKKRKETESNDGLKIVLGLLIFVFLAGYLQYKSEIHQRYESFRVGSSEDLYQILEADSGLSDQQLKQKYKKLAIKYHPDKNKDCLDCKQRFSQILKAWQILGSPQKRKAYDENNGIITKIKSKSITLTPLNYYELVQNSKDLWIIQVFDSTSQYCHHYSQFWQQIVTSYQNIVKFGRIDIWSQDNMRQFIPYSFTIFPSIYSIRRDKSTEIYGLDTRRPIDSLKQFIEKQISKSYSQIPIKSQALNSILKQERSKLVVVAGKHFGYQLKSIFSRHSDFVQAYYVEDRGLGLGGNQVRVYYDGEQFDKYILKTPQNYIEFLNDLPKYFVQEVSLCQMVKVCEDVTCAILNSTNPNSTTPTKTKFKYPQLIVKDDKLNQQVNIAKTKLQLNQNFDYIIYRDGKIDFGNLEDVDLLDIEQGEIIEVKCVPPFKIPYWSLAKLVVIGLIIMNVTNRKIQVALGFLAGYFIYNMF